jgi:LuxR family maltose regulon positive regulatory protein
MRLLLLDFRAWLAERTLPRKQEVLRPYVDQLLAAFAEGKADQEQQPSQNPTSQPKNLIEPLSERELAVLRLLAVGASNQVIGEQLIISLNTVKSHVRNIYDKLSVNNRMQAVAQARELGLL